MPEFPGPSSWRRLAGVLLLWVLLPLPFLYILLAPFWMLGMLVAGWRILDPERPWRPSGLILNLTAVIILLLVLGAGGLHVGPLRPLGHLLVLLTTLKTAQVDGLEDLKRLLGPLFLVQLIGVLSSLYIGVLPYLVLSLMLWFSVGMRVLLGGIAAAFPEFPSKSVCGRVCGGWKSLVLPIFMTLLFALPVFLLFPRLSSPFLALEGERREAGFSPSVELNRSAPLRESSRPVLRLETPDGRPVREEWLRLRATAYDEVFSGIWKATERGLHRAGKRGELVYTGLPGSISDCLELDITPLQPERRLFLPPGTLAVSAGEALLINAGGGLSRPASSDGSQAYRCYFLDPPPPVRSLPPGPPDLAVIGASSRMRALASRLASRGRNDEERAFAVVEELRRRCSYTLSPAGVSQAAPIDWFLFEGQRGHCEFFAAAMVDLLRLEGIPSRFVAGYHGGSFSGEASKILVRASERAWTATEDFFDRNILGFGLKEQFQLLEESLKWGRQLKVLLWSFSPILPLFLLLLPVLFLLGRRFRGVPSGMRGPARRELFRLEAQLRTAGEDLPESLSWRQLGLHATRRWPGAAPEMLRLTELAEIEAYAPTRKTTAAEVRVLRRKIRAMIRRTGV